MHVDQACVLSRHFAPYAQRLCWEKKFILQSNGKRGTNATPPFRASVLLASITFECDCTNKCSLIFELALNWKLRYTADQISEFPELVDRNI